MPTLVALTCLACQHVAPMEGHYARRAGDATTRLDVTRDGERLVVQLAGGDCVVRALGTPRDNTLVARFAPVESYSEARAAAEQRTIALRFDRGGADVLQADTDGYCAAGPSLVGHYDRAPMGG